MIIKLNDLHLLNFEDKKIGLTSGCFDLLHFYHLRYLERCKAECDILIVGVDSDELVHKNKNKYPEINEHHRCCMVESLKCVDIVFLMEDLNNFNFLVDKVDIIFKNDIKIYGKEVLGYDKVKVIPDIRELNSTTEIINNIKSKVKK